MRIVKPLGRIARSGHALAYLIVDTCIYWFKAFPHCWSGNHSFSSQQRQQARRLADRWHDITKMTRYYCWTLHDALRPSRQDSTDGGFFGVQHDLRRRRVRMLLQALGSTPEAVASSITTHWQHACGDLVAEAEWCDPLEWYLYTRIRLYTPRSHIDRWTCRINDTVVATPSAVRRYLASRHLHDLSTTQAGQQNTA